MKWIIICISIVAFVVLVYFLGAITACIILGAGVIILFATQNNKKELVYIVALWLLFSLLLVYTVIRHSIHEASATMPNSLTMMSWVVVTVEATVFAAVLVVMWNLCKVRK